MDIFGAGKVLMQSWLQSTKGGKLSPQMFTTQNPADASVEKGYVGDSVGDYQAVIDGATVASPTVGSESFSASNPTTKLRPITNLQEVFSADSVELKNIYISVYDNTSNDTVDSSLSTSNTQSYVASRFKNSAMYDYQANLLRPRILVDGQNILSSLDTSFFGGKGDLDIGLPIGMNFENIDFLLGKVSSIEVQAQAAQKVGTNWLRYFVQVVLDLRLHNR